MSFCTRLNMKTGVGSEYTIATGIPGTWLAIGWVGLAIGWVGVRIAGTWLTIGWGGRAVGVRLGLGLLGQQSALRTMVSTWESLFRDLKRTVPWSMGLKVINCMSSTSWWAKRLFKSSGVCCFLNTKCQCFARGPDFDIFKKNVKSLGWFDKYRYEVGY